jgi:hypothetical protein
MDGEEGGEYDELGFRQYGDDDEYERDRGYHHNQHGDDDNE